MNKMLMMTVTLLAFLAGKVYSQAPGRVRHVVLITIDGSRPDFYLDSSGASPGTGGFGHLCERREQRISIHDIPQSYDDRHGCAAREAWRLL